MLMITTLRNAFWPRQTAKPPTPGEEQPQGPSKQLRSPLERLESFAPRPLELEPGGEESDLEPGWEISEMRLATPHDGDEGGSGADAVTWPPPATDDHQYQLVAENRVDEDFEGATREGADQTVVDHTRFAIGAAPQVVPESAAGAAPPVASEQAGDVTLPVAFEGAAGAPAQVVAETAAAAAPQQFDHPHAPAEPKEEVTVAQVTPRVTPRWPAEGSVRRVSGAPPAPSGQRRATIYAITQHKGGVGKTTTTINLGAWFGQLGYRTLLVDLDPQGNLAKGLGLTPPAGAMYRVLRDPATPIDSAIVPTGLPNVDILPADTGLEAAEIEMIHAVSRETVLSRKIKAAGLRERYDCILLDCRPSLGVLTVNAMVAADRLIIPVETHFFALEALQTLLDVFETVQENLHPELEIGGIVPTLHEPGVRVCQATLEMLRERYPTLLTKTVIRKFVAYPEAQLRGQPISVLAPGTEAAECYRALAIELHGPGQPQPGQETTGTEAGMHIGLDGTITAPAPIVPAETPVTTPAATAVTMV